MQSMFLCYDSTCAFNQDLGWCLSPTVSVVDAFSGSGCLNNSCGVILSEVCGYAFASKSELQTAVDLWTSNATSAEATYGVISTWDVSAVADMSELFMDKTIFDDDISAWDARRQRDFRSSVRRDLGADAAAAAGFERHDHVSDVPQRQII